jgi:hypothetical protein
MPIHSCGFYNLGDDIELEDNSSTPSVDRRQAHALFVKRNPKPKPVKSRVRMLPPHKVPKIPVLMEKMRVTERTDQNDAISILIAEADQCADQIQTNLGALVLFNGRRQRVLPPAVQNLRGFGERAQIRCDQNFYRNQESDQYINSFSRPDYKGASGRHEDGDLTVRASR